MFIEQLFMFMPISGMMFLSSPSPGLGQRWQRRVLNLTSRRSNFNKSRNNSKKKKRRRRRNKMMTGQRSAGFQRLIYRGEMTTDTSMYYSRLDLFYGTY